MKARFYSGQIMNFLADSVKELTTMQDKIAMTMQTGTMAESLGITINSVAMTSVEPIRQDPTGGVRATNTTGKI